MQSLFGDSDEEKNNKESQKIKKEKNKPQNKIKPKQNYTAEEYKLEHDQIKRKFKKKMPPDSNKNTNILYKDQNQLSEFTLNEEKPKQQPPSIIIILSKDTKEEIKISIEELIDSQYSNEEKFDQSLKIISFPKENDYGNFEYKLKLVNPSTEKFQNLTTQMKFRLNEGKGLCYYNIGVEDNGNPLGIPKELMLASLRTLTGMATCLKAEVILLEMNRGFKGNYALLQVRQGQKEGIKLDIRIMLLGDFESGKSTLIGVLTSGKNDNGKGLSRMKVLSHKHEVLSGQTSSLSHHILGFDNQGNIVNNSGLTNSSWEEIIDTSTKVLTFIDIGGHEKYSKSLILGFCSQCPEYALIVISVIQGLTKVTEQHFKMANLLQIPCIIVITHIDLANESQIDETLLQIKNFVKIDMPEKYTIVIKNVEDIVLVSRNLIKENPIPIFLVSNLSGLNLDLFKSFLNLLPVINPFENSINLNTEFYIQQKFEVSGNTILMGTVIKGCIRKNQILDIGPNPKGEFKTIEVIEIQCKRISVRSATCGQNCTVAIRPASNSHKPWNSSEEIRKGMVLVEEKNEYASYEFLAEIQLFDNSSSEKILRQNYQPVINTQTTRQSCKLIIPQSVKTDNSPYIKKIKSRSIDPFVKKIAQKTIFIKNKAPKKVRHKKSLEITNDNEIFYGKDLKKQEIIENIKGKHVNFENIKKEENENHIEIIKEEGKNLLDDKFIIIKPNVSNFIRLRFIYYPEYITVGQKLIINDSCLKAIGWISEIFY